MSDEHELLVGMFEGWQNLRLSLEVDSSAEGVESLTADLVRTYDRDELLNLCQLNMLNSVMARDMTDPFYIGHVVVMEALTRREAHG